jgi:hypothetical protein
MRTSHVCALSTILVTKREDNGLSRMERGLIRTFTRRDGTPADGHRDSERPGDGMCVACRKQPFYAHRWRWQS